MGLPPALGPALGGTLQQDQDRIRDRTSHRTRGYPMDRTIERRTGLGTGPVTGRGYPFPANRQTPVKTLPSRILRNTGGKKKLPNNLYFYAGLACPTLKAS